VSPRKPPTRINRSKQLQTNLHVRIDDSLRRKGIWISPTLRQVPEGGR
jgi:hypothetical protein